MSVPTASSVRKITISLPPELLNFADERAAQTRTSRSYVIGQALAEIKAREEEMLAAEGYHFYAREAAEFATASAKAVSEALANDR